MTAAFNYIYYQSIAEIKTTHYYIKFKPKTIDELEAFESLDVELYDYPLNRDVVQDGDNWPEAYNGLGEGEYPWLYSVVEKDFIAPAGLETEIIEPLHIPADNATLEDEAFYMTGNSVCDSVSYSQTRIETRESYRLAPIDPCDLGALDPCGGGGASGGGGGHNSTKPSGRITFKTYSVNPGGRVSASAPLKFARIVGKRFMKIDKTYTDASGNFQLSKRFPRKVTIIVKFKASVAHGQHSVRVDRAKGGIGIWRSMFPLKKNIGTYRGNNLQNLNYEFEKGSTSIKRKTKQWLAAVIMNTTEESRLFLTEKGMQQLPDDLRLYLYAPQDQLIQDPQYDFLKRSNVPFLNQDRTLFDDIVTFTFAVIEAAATVAIMYNAAASIGGYIMISTFGAAGFFRLIPHKPDAYFYYYTSDINSMTSTKVSICAGQQLALCYLYKLTDNNPSPGGLTRKQYKKSLEYAQTRHPFATYGAFGNNVPDPTYDYHPSIVALWQSFAQHFGHTIADRIYGIGASDFELQGTTWSSDFNKSSNSKYLEQFNPQIGPPNDYFNWIPVGLFNDLLDSDVDPAPVVDNVSGFWYGAIESAFFIKPSSVSEFKSYLQQVIPSQSTQISQLFTSYGY